MNEALNLLKARLYEIDNELKISQKDVEEYEHALARARSEVADLRGNVSDLKRAIMLIEKTM